MTTGPGHLLGASLMTSKGDTMATMTTPTEPHPKYPNAARYLGSGGLAAALGVDQRTVSSWISRHGPGTDHPVPAPDVVVGEVLGWAPERVPEWQTWRATRPGQGTGGGRPSKAQGRLAQGLEAAMSDLEKAERRERR